MRIKDIVLIGMMGALLVAMQATLSFLPNIELVSLLVILFTLIFRKKAIFIISIFVLLEGFLYGFGLWWINYLYIWFLLYIIVLPTKKIRPPFYWSVLSGLYGLSFGALCSIPYFFIGGIQTAFAYWVSGIPFDLIHGISNFFVTLALFHPLYHLINHLNDQKENSLS